MTNQEINEAVARKMGWERIESKPPSLRDPDGNVRGIDALSDYCGSIVAAWEIVQSLKSDHFSLVYLPTKEWSFHMSTDRPMEPAYEYAPTAPMAICLAFLKLPEKEPSK